MKQILIILALFALVFAFAACKQGSTKQEEPKTITQTFKAEFTGTYKYVGPDTLPNKKCTDTLTVWRAIVECIGTGSPMGALRVHFDFCGDEMGHYGDLNSFMVDSDGDSLFINLSGQVIEGKLDNHPSHVSSYWKDFFEIIGGTGKYEGASGEGWTNDYNSTEDPNSHHNWIGTINLRQSADHDL